MTLYACLALGVNSLVTSAHVVWRRALAIAAIREHQVLGLVVALAALLRLYRLGEGHPGLAIYVSISRNVITSWHNWFYPSIYPDGSILADKPPLYFWLQGTFAAIFGPTDFALRLPVALSSILGVVLLFVIVRRGYGALAVMPLNVNFSRGIFLEPVATLTMLAATYFVIRGVQEKQVRYFYIAAAVMGVGFNVKLWQGLLPLPAFGLFVLVHRWTSWGKLFSTAFFAGLVFMVSAFWWPTLVWLTSSQYAGVMNSSNVWDMIFGWNLFDRFGGLEYGGSSYRSDYSWFFTRAMSLFFGISLPLAVVGVVVSLRNMVGRTSDQGALWIGWLIVGVIGFGGTSVKLASYWESVTPAVAALSGIGVAYMWRARASQGVLWWSMLVVLTGGLLYYVYAFGRVREVESYFGLAEFVSVIVLVFMAIVLALGLVSKLMPFLHFSAAGLGRQAAVYAVVSLTVLSVVVTMHNIFNPRSDTVGRIGFDMVSVPVNGGFSVQTPAQLRGTMITAVVRVAIDDLDEAISFLDSQRGDAAYLVAAASYNTTARLTFLTREPVLTLYSEYKDERITELSLLEELVQDGRLRYVMMPAVMRDMDPEMFWWIVTHSTDVTSLAGLPSNGEMRLMELTR